MLVKLRVLALLVGRGDELVALLLNPFPDTKLVLRGSEELRLLLGVDAYHPRRGVTYVVEDKKNLSLL